MKLFEQEVPEIYEGIVEVKGAAREPGGRAKIAVLSRDSDVDPVGACVGMKGTRVQSVVQELRGEKIDIVHWTADTAELVARAMAPSRVTRIVMDEDAHSMEVVVPDDQLSLAIGKKGQNVRLASRLTGWNLEVRSEAEAEEESRRARLSLSAIPGVGDVTAEFLFQHGFKSAEEVAQAGAAALAEVEGVPAEKIPAILEAAAAYAEELRVEAEAAAAAQVVAAADAAAAAAAAAVVAASEAAAALLVESEAEIPELVAPPEPPAAPAEPEPEATLEPVSEPAVALEPAAAPAEPEPEATLEPVSEPAVALEPAAAPAEQQVTPEPVSEAVSDEVERS
jgi:N utilization substance protein A